jgi:hypothetical protein
VRADQIRKRWIESLRHQARLMGQQGIQLVLVVDVPGLRREPTACEAWRDLGPDLDPYTLCAPPAALTATQQQLQRDALAAVASGLSNVQVFDPTAPLLKQCRVQHRLSDGPAVLFRHQPPHGVPQSGAGFPVAGVSRAPWPRWGQRPVSVRGRAAAGDQIDV